MPDLRSAAKAESSRLAYTSDFRIFRTWCSKQELCALPSKSTTVATFIEDEAHRGIKYSTLARRLSAIQHFHRQARVPNPTDDVDVVNVMAGVRRTYGVRPVKKTAVTVEMICKMAKIAADEGDLRGLRDRAILLLGFALGARQSELVALNVGDIKKSKQGLRVIIRKSKSDQDGAGTVVAVPYGKIACPVRALSEWLDTAKIVKGPIFCRIRRGNHLHTGGRLNARCISLVVKRYAEKAGYDPAVFAGHSLRSGAITAHAVNGSTLPKLMNISRLKSADTLMGYIRDADIFRDRGVL